MSRVNISRKGFIKHGESLKILKLFKEDNNFFDLIINWIAIISDVH